MGVYPVEVVFGQRTVALASLLEKDLRGAAEVVEHMVRQLEALRIVRDDTSVLGGVGVNGPLFALLLATDVELPHDHLISAGQVYHVLGFPHPDGVFHPAQALFPVAFGGRPADLPGGPVVGVRVTPPGHDKGIGLPLRQPGAQSVGDRTEVRVPLPGYISVGKVHEVHLLGWYPQGGTGHHGLGPPQGSACVPGEPFRPGVRHGAITDETPPVRAAPGR